MRRARHAGSQRGRAVHAAARPAPAGVVTGAIRRQYQRPLAVPRARSEVRQVSSSTSLRKSTAAAAELTGPAAGRTAARRRSARAARACWAVPGPSLAGPAEGSVSWRTIRTARSGRPGGSRSSERSRDSLRTRKPASRPAPRRAVRTVTLPTCTVIGQEVVTRGGRVFGGQYWFFTKNRYGVNGDPVPLRVLRAPMKFSVT